jgi:hypothetical protein
MPPVPKRRRVVHGDDLLYDFFQNVLAEESEALAAVPQLLLETMGVWFPREAYEKWPVMLPFVVRDPDCRSKPSIGRPDIWSSPDDAGYLRDDNSLVKALPRALEIVAPKHRRLSGARLGSEFVAAHVWRKVKGAEALASRLPELNTFVPNLVWLPGQIAKLTDREGSIVQQTAQALSWSIYRDAPVATHLAYLVEESWALLPEPTRAIQHLNMGQLNWFKATPAFMSLREQRVRTVVAALRRVRGGLPPEGKVIASRYTAGLSAVPREAIDKLLPRLERHLPPS